MVEMSQVRAEEAKWTPKSVYDILPPNSLKFDGFDYLEGEDGVDKEKAHKSLLDGFADWFRNLIAITGRIIGGAIELGVGIFKFIADGIQSFLGGIGRIFKSIFGDGPPPPEPIFSPIHADLEAAVRPHLDTIKKNNQEIAKSIEDIGALQTEMQDVLSDVAKIREDTANAIADASAALVEAEAATAHADSLNSQRIAAEELITQKITEATTAANKAKTAADGKSTNFYGPTQPTTGKLGDTWFKTDANGKTTIYQFVKKSDGTSGWVASYDQNAVDLAIDSKVSTSDYQKKMDDLNTSLGAVRDSADMAMAEALASGLLTPGNLVYNPKFETDKAGKIIGWNFNTLTVNRYATGGYRDAYISVTYPVQDTSWRQAIYNAYPDHSLMSPAAAGRTFKLTVYVRPKVTLPAGALRAHAFGGSLENSPEFPANVWTKWVVTSKFTADPTSYKGTWFSILQGTAMAAGTTVDFSEPEMAEAADNWLIIDGSVKMEKLAADSVDASKIVAGSITSKEIASDTITGDKIKANSIASNHVMANSINASHLVIAQPGNLIANGDFSSGIEPWTGAITSVASGGGTPNGKYGNPVTGYKLGQFHGTDNWFMVEPGAFYAFEIWLYADTAGSVFFMECRNQNGVGAGQTTNVTVNEGDSLSSGNNSGYLVNGVTIPANKWTKFSCVYQMSPTTTRARIGSIWFNHGKGVQTGKQALGGVSLRPMADASLVVKGSIEASHIRAGQIGTDQLATNAVKAGNIDSDAIVSRHIQADALSAREIKAEVFTQVGTNILPLSPGTTKGAWTEGADATGVQSSLGGMSNVPWWEFNSYRAVTSKNMVAVDSSIEYDFELWVFGSGQPTVAIPLVDQDGNLAVQSGGITNNAYLNSPDPGGVVRQNGSHWLVSNFTVLDGWRKYRSRVTLKPGTKFVRVNYIQGNQTGKQGTRFCIAEMKLAPHIIPQAEIDALQNEAIKKNTLVGEKNITAIQGLSQGIEGLEKANVIQDQINQEQNRINERFQANDDTFLSIQRENMKIISRSIVATGKNIVYNNHMSLDPSSGKITFKPGWFGQCIISWEGGDSEDKYVNVEQFSWRGSSESVWTPPGGALSFIYGTRWFRVDYQVEPGVQKSVNMTNPNSLMTAGIANSWVTMSRYDAIATAGHYLEYRLTLRAANRGTRYGIRFLVNGAEKAIFWSDRVGPLTPLGNGEITISLTKHISDIKDGDKIEMQTFVGSTSGAWDECFNQFGRITFIDPEG